MFGDWSVMGTVSGKILSGEKNRRFWARIKLRSRGPAGDFFVICWAYERTAKSAVARLREDDCVVARGYYQAAKEGGLSHIISFLDWVTPGRVDREAAEGGQEIDPDGWEDERQGGPDEPQAAEAARPAPQAAEAARPAPQAAEAARPAPQAAEAARPAPQAAAALPFRCPASGQSCKADCPSVPLCETLRANNAAEIAASTTARPGEPQRALTGFEANPSGTLTRRRKGTAK